MPGSSSAVLLSPESESAIVVLSNTTALCDMSDYTTQFLTQVVFDFPAKEDVGDWVKKSVEVELE
jgi:hypothetical protein